MWRTGKEYVCKMSSRRMIYKEREKKREKLMLVACAWESRIKEASFINENQRRLTFKGEIYVISLLTVLEQQWDSKNSKLVVNLIPTTNLSNFNTRT